MAVLSESERAAVWRNVMRQAAVNLRIEPGIGTITKPELRAAIDALDTWMDDNAISANQAIPQPARSGLTTKQKAALLMYVIARRYLVEV